MTGARTLGFFVNVSERSTRSVEIGMLERTRKRRSRWERDCGKDILDGGVLSLRAVEWYTIMWGRGEREQTMDGNDFADGGCEMALADFPQSFTNYYCDQKHTAKPEAGT